MKAKFEIERSIGVLSDTGKVRKELNIVRWCNQKPVLDLRNWYVNEDETKEALKGITLTLDEARALAKVLNTYLAENEVQ